MDMSFLEEIMTKYEQCANCGGWIRLDQTHFVAYVSGKIVHVHDDDCLRILKHKVEVTQVTRVLAVIYQD